MTILFKPAKCATRMFQFLRLAIDEIACRFRKIRMDVAPPGASDLGEIVAINMSFLTERGFLLDEFKYVLLLELDLEFLQEC